MDKEWFIAFDGKSEGPFSFEDLKFDTRITPDTLVWKQGFTDWVPIRHVPELQDIFKDEHDAPSLLEDLKPKPAPIDLMPEDEALTIQNDPSQFFLIILIFFLLLFYLFYQFYGR